MNAGVRDEVVEDRLFGGSEKYFSRTRVAGYSFGNDFITIFR